MFGVPVFREFRTGLSVCDQDQNIAVPALVLESHRARRAAVARVAVLEELAGRGRLTEELAVELAALRPRVAQLKQQKKDSVAKSHRARRAAVARVAVLEEFGAAY
ncbi:hypothetical protein [Saccharopolyspora spinosa]|uniref:hypothetical protein n=1 Tax=Saccharopolyspora spinosa TaxID=60894 RepID=UPI001ED93BF3|nr:hypothetical protein [Saccharopolyspora spinosa]